MTEAAIIARLDFDLARRAHEGTSFTPGKRAHATQQIEWAVSRRDKLAPWAALYCCCAKPRLSAASHSVLLVFSTPQIFEPELSL
jgi:hypothetical protein